MKQVIITGDDFGLSLEVNAAIEEAHKNGVLSTTSLMVGAQAAADAVQRAKRLPELKVGLHVVVVRGQAVLPHQEIPSLVNSEGRFANDLVRLGVKYSFRPSARRQLQAEIRAQFESFHSTGLELDHVNAHNHMHLHPTVLGLILKIGREYNLRAVRVPYEPFLYSWLACGDSFFSCLWPRIFLAPWVRLMKARLRRADVQSNDYVFGMNASGRMQEDYILRLLACLPEGVSEIYFHPATRGWGRDDPLLEDYRPDEELSALISPVIRKRLNELGIKATTFGELVSARAVHQSVKSSAAQPE